MSAPSRPRLRTALQRFCLSAIDFVYPPLCPFCGTSDLPDPPRVRPRFCEACVSLLVPTIPEDCPRCRAPIGPHTASPHGCPLCRDDSFAFNGISRLGVYDDELRIACLRAKDEVAAGIPVALADLLWEREQEQLIAAKPDLVMPVPDHWTRRLFRAEHPASILARELAHRLQVPFSRHILAKIRRIVPQAGLSGRERRRSLRGVFRVRHRAKLDGQSVLLVDDVLTTGTTANAVARVLKKHGAKTVHVAVVARGIGRSSASK